MPLIVATVASSQDYMLYDRHLGRNSNFGNDDKMWIKMLIQSACRKIPEALLSQADGSRGIYNIAVMQWVLI